MSCTNLQLPPEPLTRGLPPFSLSSTEFVEPPRTKFLGTPLRSTLENRRYCTKHSLYRRSMFICMSAHHNTISRPKTSRFFVSDSLLGPCHLQALIKSPALY